MEDFQKQPWAEICWYFTETREQYRLTGKLSVIDKNAEDKAQRVSMTHRLFLESTWNGINSLNAGQSAHPAVNLITLHCLLP